MAYQEFVKTLQTNGIGDLSSIAGVIISITGFIITIINLLKLKSTSEKIQAITESIHHDLDTKSISNLISSAISTIEEIQRLHTTNDLHQLRQRYYEIRKCIVQIRSAYKCFTDDQLSIFTSIILHANNIEQRLVAAINQPGMQANHAKFYKIMAGQLDQLHSILIELTNKEHAYGK